MGYWKWWYEILKDFKDFYWSKIGLLLFCSFGLFMIGFMLSVVNVWLFVVFLVLALFSSSYLLYDMFNEDENLEEG